MTTRYDQILNYIAAHPGCTRRDVADALGANYTYVSHQVARAAIEGNLTGEVSPKVDGRKGKPPVRLFVRYPEGVAQ